MKKFNTTAVCMPSKHYMVDLTERVKEIKKLVDAGEYFTINCARQYGKTTTIEALCRSLEINDTVVSLDFQDMSESVFRTEGAFAQGMARILCDAKDFMGAQVPDEFYQEFENLNKRKTDEVKLDELFRIFLRWCNRSEKRIVLIVDEIDRAANNQVFLDFLSQLRSFYLKRQKNQRVRTFHSVILAGVVDIKYLKSKLRDESDARVNSPWNIAADFTIDMSLSEKGIQGMLEEYEADHHTGMDTGLIAKKIREYTSGYPFLVSRICQWADERLVPEKFGNLTEAWTDEGIEAAIKSLVMEKNTLFDSLMGKLQNLETLRNQLKKILLQGETVEYLPDDREQELLMMYGFIVNDHNRVAVANRVFEMRLYKYYVGESRFAEEQRGNAIDHKPEFIKDGLLDVPLIMERFIETQKHIRNQNDEEAERKFVEEEGREKFLTYLSPIINGVGTYSIEEQTRDRKSMDVVIHYMGRRYIIELKIWRGERYQEKGEKQLAEYLDFFGLDTGYLLSFNFNKVKEPGVELIHVGDKMIYEGIV